MKRTCIALVVGFTFLVPVAGWSAQPGSTLPEQVASLSAQVAELKGQVANLTTQLNNEVAARQAAIIQYILVWGWLLMNCMDRLLRRVAGGYK